MQQMLLWQEPRDLEKEMDKLRLDYEKLRKSMFQRLNEQNKKYQELLHEHELLKLNICKGKIVL